MYAGFGIGLYDLLASRGPRLLPRHRHLGQQQVTKTPRIERSQSQRSDRVLNALVDDARFVVSAARTAAKLGASIATQQEWLACHVPRPVSGATVRCLESEAQFMSHAER